MEDRKRWIIHLLVAVLLVLLFVPSCLGNELKTRLYVVPENYHGQCPNSNTSHCQTFNSYVSNATTYFHSNTAFLFLPGIHPLNQTAQFCNLSNISLVAISGQQNASITCAPPHSATTDSPVADTGLHFCNITRVHIQNLSFTGCGHKVTDNYYFALSASQAAISVGDVTDMLMDCVRVSYSFGYGLFAWNIFGESLISRSVFAHNSAGGNAAFYYVNCSHKDTIKTSVLTITMSYFLHGNAEAGTLASGILAFIWCTNVDVELDRITTNNNTVTEFSAGGNIAVLLRNHTSLIHNKVTIKNCSIEAGYAHFGGGLFLSFLEVPSALINNSYSQKVWIQDTNFTRNHATGEGGGLYIIVHEVAGLSHPVGFVSITHCIFDSNTLDNDLTAGVALHINNHYIPGYSEHITPQYKLNVTHSVFTNNSVILSALDSSAAKSSAVFVLQTQAGVYFNDCIFNFNNVTGLMVVGSNVIFNGEIVFQGNSGFDGGGMLLCDRAFMYLTPYTNVSFIGNHAINTGGGIFVDGKCLQSIPGCFFQLTRSIIENRDLLNTTYVHFASNRAESAGSALYGGSVDFCVIMNPWEYTPHTFYGSEVFERVFRVFHDPLDFSIVASDPYEVCFCSEPPHAQPNCASTEIERLIYPGSTFSVTVVAVGHRNGTAPGTVKASSHHPTHLGELETNQGVNVNCTTLSYTAYSPAPSAEVVLQVEGPILSAPPSFKIKSATVKLTFKKCPFGFNLTNGVCACNALLSWCGMECVLDPAPVVKRSSYSWIGYHNTSHAGRSGIIFHKYCPFDFCKMGLVNITTTNTSFNEDAQCANSRTGMLCGQCLPGLSIVLGSSRCLQCSNKYISLIIVIAVAGIVLVAFLNISKLTVTDGAINGLIFYSNIVQVNSYSFFVPKNGLNPLFKVFIAWVNLDLGIEVCFYDGMNTFAKVFLQFAFPTYVLFLAYLIILLSRKYRTVARLMGRNAVQVLATLFLLSYAKFLRIIISVFSATDVVYPDMSIDVKWLEDGNIPYLRGKHMALLITGFLAVCFSLPYTVIVTFHQCIQRSNIRFCHWIHRFKPLLDAYGGPYKDKYRFWTGLLLFIRLFLFVALAANIQHSPYTNLQVILFTCFFVISLGWVLGGVYRHWTLNALEASFLFNLAILSAGSRGTLAYDEARKQNELSSISVGLAIATFALLLLFRLCKVVYPLCKKTAKTFVEGEEDGQHHVVQDISHPPCSSVSTSVVDIRQWPPSDVHIDEENEQLLT